MTDIPFTVARNYFVKNSVEQLDDPRIETADRFNRVFGMATTMGDDGKPTEIDFQRHSAIAVILPETDMMTTIAPVSLKKDAEGKITFTYRKEVGAKQTFKMRPALLLVIDKAETGTVDLKEQE